MKKSLILLISIIAITGLSSAVSAGTYTASGGSITIGGTSDAGGALTANTSPSVWASVVTTTDTYGICTVNPKAGADAIGYNVHSASGAVYLKVYSDTPTTVDTPTAGGDTTGYASK